MLPFHFLLLLYYLRIFAVLSICASGSALAAKTPLLHGISGTLKDILSGSGLVAGTTVSPTRSADQGPSPRRGYGDLVGAVCGRATSRRRRLLLSRTPAGSVLASRRRRCPS
ncbi:unnamed protein product [Triticum turgidum subsp. durum]|uniref:Secreted protein n=1 Tax=Triticum turgidum subsp. durum TaxID=4567 RepID=A0A9R0R4K7_TRITD|nr:unnamed protein product [Triticum turgidum subsp. durum]